MYPVFVHCYLDLVERGGKHAEEAKVFMKRFKKDYEEIHPEEIREFESLSLPEHIKENELVKTWRYKRDALRFTVLKEESLQRALVLLHI